MKSEKKTEAARKAHGDINLVGQRFGKLTVISFAGYAKGRGQWNCKCDCGNDFVAHTSALKSGNTTSCRCKVDLTGQRFGELVVREFHHQESGKNSYWLCDCDCGETTVVCSSNLTRKTGGTKSCGHIDSLVGHRFGRLVVESLAFVEVNSYWNCRCDCGNSVIVRRNGLTTGNTKSCGCLQRESVTVHGLRTSTLYKVWEGMMRRCYDTIHKDYKYYGERGIIVCKRWHNVENFVADMSPRPEGYEIDRIDTNGNYEPENCRWATRKEQMRNTRRNRLISYNGKTMCLSEWAEELGVSPDLIRTRLNNGWPIKDALSAEKHEMYHQK